MPLGCSKESDNGGEATESGGITNGGTIGDDSNDDGNEDAGTDPTISTGDDNSSGGMKFDTLPEEGGDDGDCQVPEHTPCDSGTMPSYGQAMGLGCPGELPFIPIFDGGSGSIGLRSSFGPTATFNPREGSKYVVLSTGLVSDLDIPNTSTLPSSCNNILGAAPEMGTLPPPLVPQDVGGGGCYDDPSLVGTGDCSNTIQGQFDDAPGGVQNSDYTELRLENIQVPEGVTSFSYDVAFFSTEYPEYFETSFNDMYVGWLESLNWTGNISFDNMGNPISLNAGFLDFKEGAPELANTCVNFNAGTQWLTSTAEVQPGEDITIVFAIFDLADSSLDSFVFLDNFRWGCEGGPPSTTPAG